MQHYHVFDTEMGFCAIAWSEAGIARFQLPAKSAEAAERLIRRRVLGAEPGAPPEHVAAVVEAAKRYFRGEETDFSQVRVDLAGVDPFLVEIYAALRRVGWGRTTTYGALASEIGARRGPGDGEKPGALDHSLPPGAGCRGPNRRFFGAWRLDDQDAHAGAGGRSHAAASASPAILRLLSRFFARSRHEREDAGVESPIWVAMRPCGAPGWTRSRQSGISSADGFRLVARRRAAWAETVKPIEFRPPA
jgi:O6-methylguanine-DNA--protein-cysteine methyltransferase